MAIDRARGKEATRGRGHWEALAAGVTNGIIPALQR